MDEAEYCHRVALMYKGKVIAMDTPRALKQDLGVKSMEDVFINEIEKQEAQAT